MALRSSRITPFQESSSAAFTPGGVPYQKVTLSFAGQKALLLYADRVKDWETTSLVIMNHGYADSYTWVDPAASVKHGAASAMIFVERGWVVISHNAGGNNWGSDAAVSDVMDAYDYAARRWFFEKIAVMGFSMGGLLAYNVTGKKALPQVDAAITINGVVDIRTNWLDEAYRVYGGTNESQMTQYMAGNDPLHDDPDRWAGLPMFITSSPNDSVTPTAAQAQRFYDRASTPEKIVFRTHTGSHLAQESFMVSEVLAWMKDVVGFKDHVAGQVRPSVGPAPLWVKGSSGSGVAFADGTPAVLAMTDGSVVAVSATL